MKYTPNAVVGILACTLSIAGATLTAAQDVQLTRIGLGLSTHGYEATHPSHTGALRDDQSTTVSLWLRAGTEYLVRGTCDNDCSDLDLELKSPSGSIVDRDFDADDVPEVGVRPTQSGWYRVRVVMAACSIEPCRYAVGTFGR